MWNEDEEEWIVLLANPNMYVGDKGKWIKTKILMTTKVNWMHMYVCLLILKDPFVIFYLILSPFIFLFE